MRRVIKSVHNRHSRSDSSSNQIVIVGANDIGVHLAHVLGQEGQNTFLIDEGEDFLQNLDEEVDVLAIAGNPISLHTLRDAGISEQSRLIAVTASDKLNLLLLFLGQNLGIKEGYSLIHDQEYFHSFYPVISRLGVNLHLINLWETVIQKIERKFNLETQTIYSDGNAMLMAIRFFAGHPSIGKRISQLKLGSRSKVLQMIKDGKYINDFARLLIDSGDIILVRFDPSEKERAMERLVTFDSLPKVMIGGAGLIQVVKNHWPNFSKKLVCIEKDYAKCQKMLKVLESGLILHGDGLDISLLNEAGIGEAGMFIAASENDEINLLSSLLARSYGVDDVLTILRRRQHTGMLERLELNGIISIPQVVVDYLISRIIPEKHTSSVNFHVLIERGVLSEGIHFVYRGGLLILLEQTSLRDGEEVITVQLITTAKSSKK